MSAPPFDRHGANVTVRDCHRSALNAARRLRLLLGSEVSAVVDLVQVDEVGVRQLGPAPRRPNTARRERTVTATGMETPFDVEKPNVFSQ